MHALEKKALKTSRHIAHRKSNLNILNRSYFRRNDGKQISLAISHIADANFGGLP